MVAYLVRRLLSSLLVLTGVLALVFITLRLSGDPVELLLRDGGTPSPDEIALLRDALRLDGSLPEQYLDFIGRALRGDFGQSLRSRAPAFDEVLARLPATIELALAAALVAVAIALPAGLLAAASRGRPTDLLCRLVSLLGMSVPSFWLGLMLIIVFGVWLRWLPISGRGDGPVGDAAHLVLPALTLGLAQAGILTRLLRASLLEVLSADFARTARGKGLPEWRVLLHHALRAALIPVTTIGGLQLGSLLGGAVIIETIFAWPGLGRYVVEAIGARDYPVVQAAVTLLAANVIIINLAVDLCYLAIDPRLRRAA